jgi:Xaa-Pro aminopeptidase
MPLSKREFLKLSGIATGVALTGDGCSTTRPAASPLPTLTPVTDNVAPIAVAEREARIAKAQALMAAGDIDALIVEPGSAMLYFSGISWWRSERLTALVIPRHGDIGVVTPHFEEPSVRESMTFGDDVRTWNEDENPFERVAGIIRDRGVASGRVGIEDTVRMFVVEGLRRAGPRWQMVAATPVTQECRMIKSPQELVLMKKAAEVTMRAYAYVYANLHQGMTAEEVVTLMNDSQVALGGTDPWAMALLGPASAYPHGTRQPQQIRAGQIVLMDCGCAVQGYQSDISRTFVSGEASSRQREVWNTVRTGQRIAFETARPGTPAGRVDDAVRAYYESLGYGPGYATPGLSHRTGHGIGMDGHESVNFVHGEVTPLRPGMCFSNEPGIYIYGEFGVRLEDCIHITEDGPAWFTVPPDDIDQPMGRLG